MSDAPWFTAYFLVAAYFAAAGVLDGRTSLWRALRLYRGSARNVWIATWMGAMLIWGLLWLPAHLAMMTRSALGVREFLRRKLIPAVGGFASIAWFLWALGF